MVMAVTVVTAVPPVEPTMKTQTMKSSCMLEHNCLKKAGDMKLYAYYVTAN